MPLAAPARAPALLPPDAYRAERERRAARRSLAEFSRQAWKVTDTSTPLEWTWHLDALCNHLQAAFEDWMARQRDAEYPQRVQDFLINIPPGTGKSRFVSVFFPAWAWLQWPEWKAICLSANPRVALRDARLSRLLIQSKWYKGFGQDWELDRRQNAASDYHNTKGGWRKSFGITSVVTGDRGDCLLIDDPNDAKKVTSEATRTSINETWDTAIYNRVNDMRSSLRIGIMQRVHENDWSGHVLAQGGFDHLSIPMEYLGKRTCKCASCRRGTTFLGWKDPRTEDGELLDPRRYPRPVVEKEKKRLGSYGYSGQHQQAPTPADGGIFKRKWWKHYATLPFYLDEWILSADLAFAKSEGTSWVVIQVWAKWKANRYLVKQVRAHLNYPETKRALHEVCAEFPQLGRKYIENKANGPAILADLRDEIAGLIAENVKGDKMARAIANTPEIESGNVLLPAIEDNDGNPIPGREWVKDFIDEHAAAGPTAALMDQVDATSQALKHLKTSGDYDPDEWADSRGR